MKKFGESLDPKFFQQSPEDCARDLIGCRLAWEGCAGVIVETEAYAAEGDEACHTHFRPSARRFIAEHPAGSAYVYLNYGVHWLLNFLVKGGDADGFVLIRALAPREGLEQMRLRRRRTRETELCSGPGKLTQALGIDCSMHGMGLVHGLGLSLSRCSRRARANTIACRRVGISREIDRKWRFVLAGSSCLSVGPGAE